MPGWRPNGVDFRRFLSLEGPLLLAPNILQYSTATIQADTTYVVVDFSLTLNRNYSIVSYQKASSYQANILHFQIDMET